MSNVDTSLPQKPCVFIVDDEISVIRALTRELYHLDVDIHAYSNSREALEALLTLKPDVVVSDARMPNVDGITILEKVVELYPLSERILLTGYADLDSCFSAIHRGKIHHLLEKPWDNEHLLRVVNKGIELAQLRQHNHQLQQLTHRQNEQLEHWNTKLEQQVQEQVEELHSAYTATIATLSDLVERRMRGRQSNTRLVVELAFILGERIGLGQDQLSALRYSVLLRNVGKLSFDDALLETPYLEMTKVQRQAYQAHPTLAALAVGSAKPLRQAAIIIAHHCENSDGSGFPAQIKLEDIPLAAQVLRVASDYYDALDGYLFSHSHSERNVLQWFKEKRNVFYGAAIVDALVKVFDEFTAHHSRIELESTVSSHALKAGMRLSRDLVSSSGAMLLRADTVLNETLIAHLLKLEQNRNEALIVYIGNRTADV